MATREALAAEAFAYTARYDTAIAAGSPRRARTSRRCTCARSRRSSTCPTARTPTSARRYYAQVGARAHVLAEVQQHHGKQLSFNNLLDLDAARAVVREFEVPACAIVKHNNPCGVAIGSGALDAYRRAFACDPLSAFGGVIALNRRVDRETAEAIAEQFVEVLFAPGYDDGALEVLDRRSPTCASSRTASAACRCWASRTCARSPAGCSSRTATGRAPSARTWRSSPSRPPTEEEWRDLLFAWRVCRHVKSNAIVLARDGATVGIGAGQMSRVDSVRLAVEKSRLEDAQRHGDGLRRLLPLRRRPRALAIEAGVTAIVQPGGSKRDDEVIAAADEAGITMVFTGRRHFRH